jgi:diguanylate cyclase (GGDEF)-like protein/PAS domain S-box-containing protein
MHPHSSHVGMSALTDRSDDRQSSALARDDDGGEIATREATILEAAARGEVAEELRRSELLHRTLTANLPDTTMFLLDRDLRILIAEGEGLRALGWFDEDMFRGRRVVELQGELPSDVLAISLECYRAAFSGDRGEFEFTSQELSFTVTAVPVHGTDDTVESVLVVVRDITQRKTAERRLAQHAGQQECVARLGQFALREREPRSLFKHVLGAVAATLELEFCAVLELRAGAQMLDIVASIGFRDDAVRHRKVPNNASSQAGHVLSRAQPVVTEDLATETRFEPSPLLLDHGVVSSMSVLIEGRERPFGVLSAHTSRRRSFGAADVNFLTAVANVISAAVERHAEEEISREAALRDPLTGLPNRTMVLDRLEQALRRRRRDDSNVAAIMIDLDRFKVINDSLGHGAGDGLLLALAPRLREILRTSDTVARLSGDEFVIVCEAPRGLHQVIEVAQRAAAAIAQPFALDSGEHFVSASIGISVAARSDETPESLLRDADAAMYRAKKAGGGRFEVFDDEMRAEVLGRLRIETELRHALDHNELRVFYQPIVDTATGIPRGLEALVRWQHPQRGLVAPLDFIAIAEETGLIVDLGRWVLETACRQGAIWQRRFDRPLKMFVNVSGRQIADPLFPVEVAEVVRSSGLRPGTLGLEVTESVLIDEAGATMNVLDQLTADGVRLTLDDFGTGYSSLSHLKQFPLAGLKIDAVFTYGLGRTTADAAIVKSVIDLARALGLTVVAEGVETDAQLRHLRQLGCPRAQGHLFSRARCSEEIDAFLGQSLTVAPADVGVPQRPSRAAMN